MRYLALLLLVACPKKGKAPDAPAAAEASDPGEERLPFRPVSLPGGGGDWRELRLEELDAEVGGVEDNYATFNMPDKEIACGQVLQEHMQGLGWTHLSTTFQADESSLVVVTAGEELWDLVCEPVGSEVQGTVNWWRTRPHDPWESMSLPEASEVRCRPLDCAFVYETEPDKVEAIWSAALVRAGWGASEQPAGPGSRRERLWKKDGATMRMIWTRTESSMQLRARLER